MNQKAVNPMFSGVVPSGDFKRAEGFKGLREVIRLHGGDPATLLSAFGLQSEMFDHADTYVNYPAVVELMEHCAKSLNAPYLGLEIGQTHTIEVLGKITVLLSACRTVEEALRNVGKYMYVHSPGGVVALNHKHADLASLSYQIKNPGLIAHRQINEMSMATSMRVLQGLLGQRLKLAQVHFTHPKPSCSDQPVREFFDAPILYEQEVDALFFASHLLANPVLLDSASVIHFAQQSLDALAPQAPSDLVWHSQNLILQLLPLGLCTLKSLAHQFGMSERNLQLKLKEQGTDFRSLMQQQRERLARQYVGATAKPISHIASLLGYSDQAVFTRAFKAWTGNSPAQFRRSALICA